MTLAQTLAGYGEYHRDRRNVLTHMVGVPMIVLAMNVLLQRGWSGSILGFEPTPALGITVGAAVWYLRLDMKAGLLMTALLILFYTAGAYIAGLSTAAWLGWGTGLFVVGWALQFLGHRYEGRKPAFMDDIRGLLHGPLFVAYEALWSMGLSQRTKREVEALRQEQGAV